MERNFPFNGIQWTFLYISGLLRPFTSWSRGLKNEWIWFIEWEIPLISPSPSLRITNRDDQVQRCLPASLLPLPDCGVPQPQQSHLLCSPCCHPQYFAKHPEILWNWVCKFKTIFTEEGKDLRIDVVVYPKVIVTMPLEDPTNSSDYINVTTYMFTDLRNDPHYIKWVSFTKKI